MIEAIMCSDEPVEFRLYFDATPWFEQAKGSELRYLMNGDWGRECPAGDVAAFVAANNDDRLARVFDAMRGCVRFGCTIHQRDAMAWLARHRPYLLEDDADDDDEYRLPLKRHRSGW